MFKERYRIIIAALTTLALAVIFGNFLSINWAIRCMTEEQFHYENFTIDLGLDVFDKVDFDPPRPPDAPKPPTADVPAWSFPDIDTPSIGFDWRTFKLARHNPSLFLRIVKRVAQEVGVRLAERAGEALDPTKVDFSQFSNGLNISDLDLSIVDNLKKYLLEKLASGQKTLDIVDQTTQNLTSIDPANVELTNITWSGEINGRIKVIDKPADYYYTSTDLVLIFTVGAVGALFGVLLFSRLQARRGLRTTVAIAGVLSAIATGLLPLVAALGVIPLLVLRFVQGLAVAVIFPAIGTVTLAWSPLDEGHIFMAALSCFIQLGAIIAYTVVNFFCSLDAWEVAFPVLSLLSVLVIALWFIIFRDTPGEHAKVTIREQNKIQANRTTVDGRSKHNRVRIPLKPLYTEKSNAVTWLAFAAKSIAMAYLLIDQPALLGPLLIIGLFLQLITRLQDIYLFHKLTLPVDTKTKGFNSIAFSGAAILLILSVVASSKLASALLVILALILLSFDVGGHFYSLTGLNRRFPASALTFAQVIFSLAYVAVSLLVAHQPCSIKAIAVAILLFVAGIVYAVFVVVEDQEHTPGQTTELPNVSAEVQKPIIIESN